MDHLQSEPLTYCLQAARRKEVQKLNISHGSIEADRLSRLRKLVELVPGYRAQPSHERKRIGLTLKDINLTTRESSGIDLTQAEEKKPSAQELHIEDAHLTHGQATLSDMDQLVSPTDFDTPIANYLVMPDPSDDDLREILLSCIGQTFISTSYHSVPLLVKDLLHEDISSYDLPSEPHNPPVLPEEMGSSAMELAIPVPPQPTEPESSSPPKHQNNLEHFILQPDNQANTIDNARDIQHLLPAENLSPPSDNGGSITPQPLLSPEESHTFSQQLDASISEPPIRESVETQESMSHDDAPSQLGNQEHQIYDAAQVQHIPSLWEKTPPSTQPPDISISQLPSEACEYSQSALPDNPDEPALQKTDTTFKTDNTLDAQQVSALMDSEYPKQDVHYTLASLYREYCDSIPKVASLASSDSKSDGQLTTLDDTSEIQTEYAMSRHQLQLTVEEGKIWDELVEPGITPSNITIDVSLASLEEKSHLMSQSYEKRTNPPTAQTYEESKEIIEALGVPCMEVAGAFEAEALAASLVLNGHADYVVSEDTVCTAL